MAIWNQTTSEENNEKPSVPPATATAPHATAIPVAKEGAAKGPRESVFGAGVTIEGKIEGDADIRIAGKFKGDIQIKGDLHIDKGARLTAKISAANVTLGGELDGNVVATGQVRLMESAQMMGDLKASTLTVAAGSRMRGHVEFGWNPAEAAKFANGQAHENEKNRAGG
ncbi:MAG: bactofilin family protein [Candidatus Binatia bacterium]